MEQLGPMFNEPKAPYLVFHFQKETVLCCSSMHAYYFLTFTTKHRSPFSPFFIIIHLICIALVVDQIWGVLCDRPVEQTLNQVKLNYAV